MQLSQGEKKREKERERERCEGDGRGYKVESNRESISGNLLACLLLFDVVLTL